MIHGLRPILKKDPHNLYPLDPFQDNEAGKICGRGSIHILNLSKRFDADKNSVNAFQIDAIPDVWARAILFEMALYNPTHPLHEHITGEWRGLLALIALKETRKLPILSSRIDLNEKNEFLKVLKTLQPENKLDPNTDQNILYTFKYKNVPIGLSYINTIVCTGSEYKLDPGLVSWIHQTENYLIDPIKYIRTEEKIGLAFWLVELWKNLRNIGESFTQKIGTNEYPLLHIILLFIAELLEIEDPKNHPNLVNEVKETLKELGKSNVIEFDQSNMNIGSDYRKAFDFHGIYQYIDKSVRPQKLTSTQSHVRIIPSPERKPTKTFLLIDKFIPNSWSRAPHDILVYDSISLANIPDDYKKLGNNKTVLLGKNLSEGEAGAVWMLPDDFFTDEAYVIEQEGALPGSRGYENKDNELKGLNTLKYEGKTIIPLLPIKENILDYFSIDDLTNRLELLIRNNKLVAKLRLKLGYDDTENNFRDYIIEKEYEIKNFIENIPVIRVWPNFVRPGYNSYYTYFNSARQTQDTFYAQPYSYNVKNIETSSFNNNNEFIKYETNVNGQISLDINSFNPELDKMVRLEISRMDTFPEAMKCYVQQKMDNSSVNLKHIGFIFNKKPILAVNISDQNCVVGIDFGTTSTNVCIREGNRPAVFAKFNSSLFSKVTSTSSDYERQTYEDFLPNKDEETPFLTIFKMINTLRTENNEIRPLFDGHIYFIDDYSKFSVGSSGIKTDIKWGIGKREYLKAFIRQISLQCSVEALSKGLNKVKFRFSYPSAFSRTHRTALENAMKQALGDIHEKVSNDIIAQPELETESQASTYFYAIPPQIKGYNIPRATFTDGVIIIDIGGGTSDISIIEGRQNEFKFKTSLKFAGREIFLRPILRHPRFLNLFGVDNDSIAKIESLVGSNDISSEAYTQADALIRNKSKDLLNILNNSYDKPEFVGFIQLIRIGLSGLFYYIGMLIRHLKEKDSYASNRIPTVYVGGNGAKMFHWLAQGHYSNSDNLLFQSTLLNEMFEQKVKDESTKFDPETSQPLLNIYLTPTELSKPEVAYGLVVDRDAKNVPILTKTDLKDNFISGESFNSKTIDDDGNEVFVEKNFYDLVYKSDLNNIDTDAFGNVQFKKFLRVFDSCSRELEIPTINVTSSVIENISATLRQDLNTLINKIVNKGQDVENEIQDEHVIFINELKLFMDYKIDEWAKSF